MFEGSFVAIVTPFKEDESVDESKLKELVEFQIAEGIHGIVPCGTTGESPTLSHEEHDRIVALTVEEVDGRVPVIAGAGSNSTLEALRLTKHAKAVGADGALVITPYYNKPTQEGLYAHFIKIADEVDLPIIVYNVPSRTGVDVLPDTLSRLSEHPNIAGIKEATGLVRRSSEILQICSDDFVVLSGNDDDTYPILAVGGRGVISVVANVVPADIAGMCNAFKEGDFELARNLHYKTLPLAIDLFVETNPIPVKTALMLMGKLNGKMRLPLVPMARGNLQKLHSTLDKANL